MSDIVEGCARCSRADVCYGQRCPKQNAKEEDPAKRGRSEVDYLVVKREESDGRRI